MVITESALRLASVLLSLCFLQLSPSDTPFLDLTQDFHNNVNVNGSRLNYDCAKIDILDKREMENMSSVMSFFDTGVTLVGRPLTDIECALLEEAWKQGMELDPTLIMGISIALTSASFVWTVQAKRRKRLVSQRNSGDGNVSVLKHRKETKRCYETPTVGNAIETKNASATKKRIKKTKRVLEMSCDVLQLDQTPIALNNPAGDMNLDCQFTIGDQDIVDGNKRSYGAFTNSKPVFAAHSLPDYGDAAQDEPAAHSLPDLPDAGQGNPTAHSLTDLPSHFTSDIQNGAKDNLASHSLTDLLSIKHGAQDNAAVHSLPVSGIAPVSSSSSTSSVSDSNFSTAQSTPRSEEGYTTASEEEEVLRNNKSVIHLIKSEPKDRDQAISYIEERLKTGQLSPTHKSVLEMRLANHRLMKENARRSWDGGFLTALLSPKGSPTHRRTIRYEDKHYSA